jgi:hypothetical protein
MMRQGVKNLILPSRSGPKSAAATDLLDELRHHGVNAVAPICDVSSLDSLSSMLEECAISMPPIKGCINACMTLQVGGILFSLGDFRANYDERIPFSRT